MESYAVSDLNGVRQLRERARYQRETVFSILDSGLVAHVAFIDASRPVVIPMAYGRDGDRLFLHGGRKSRIMRTAAGAPVSVGVTLVDGLVVGRSMFESSMNYRAVVLHGRAIALENAAAQLHALRVISEHNLPGRWNEVRPPYEKELRATGLLEVQVDAASAKVREGLPIDDYDTRDDRVWVGVVPITTALGSPIADSTVPRDVDVPASLKAMRQRRDVR